MFDAFLWGIIGSISLTVGGLIGILFKMGKRPLGLGMAVCILCLCACFNGRF